MSKYPECLPVVGANGRPMVDREGYLICVDMRPPPLPNGPGDPTKKGLSWVDEVNRLGGRDLPEGAPMPPRRPK